MYKNELHHNLFVDWKTRYHYILILLLYFNRIQKKKHIKHGRCNVDNKDCF